MTDQKLNEVRYTTMRPKVVFDQKTRKIINGTQVLDDLIRTKFKEWQYENGQIAMTTKPLNLESLLKEGAREEL